MDGLTMEGWNDKSIGRETEKHVHMQADQEAAKIAVSEWGVLWYIAIF